MGRIIGLRDGTTSSDFTPFNTTSNFDLTSSVNDLYKLNSVHGGVIVPRGVSIVGSDLRKPQFDHYTFLILRMMILKDLRFSESQVDVTFSNLLFLTEDPNGSVYRDYTSASTVMPISHTIVRLVLSI